MNQQTEALRATMYLPANEAEKVRAYAREHRVSDRQAIRMLVIAGLNFISDKGASSELLARFHREYSVRNQELLAMLVEVVMAVRFLADGRTPGMSEKLRDKSREALTLLRSKIAKNDRPEGE